MLDATDFTLEGYRGLLRAFSERGYAARLFHDVEVGKPHVVMRHDVDYCLDYAVPIADVEAEEDIRSSYFVLMRSEFYNPASPASVKVLSHLSNCGHEIGLHFDASQYEQDFKTLNAACRRECAQLEDIVGQAVRCVSFHRPAQALMARDEVLGGRLHAYQAKFFKEMGYCADSQGCFRYGHPLDHDSLKEMKAIQIVTHPVWWYLPNSESPVQRLERVLADVATKMTKQMSENSIPFRDHLYGAQA